jgi:hypothetical protein
MSSRTWSLVLGLMFLAACHADPGPSADATDASSTAEPDPTGTTLDSSTTTTAVDDSTTGAPAPAAAATLSEIDCHGRTGVELAAEPGSDLGGIQIVVDDVPDYVIPSGTISDGLFVVRQADASPGIGTAIGCHDVALALVRDGETLDELVLPPFPGSFEGTTWCSGVSEEPFGLCTPTIGAPNQPYVDPGEILFDRFEPVEIDLTIDAAGLAALAVEPREYVAGTFSVTTADGTTEPIAIGIALKGSVGGSFVDLSGKAAFKLKLDFVDDDRRFLGLKGLKLNNMLEDPSQLREAIAYAVLGELGIAVPRSGYAEVRLNGESYGLHATIERVDDVWLSRWFESTAHLYEATIGLDVTPGREDEFSVDEGTELDVSDLTALMAVSALPDDQYLAGLEAHLHLDAVLRAWAATMLLGHGDSYMLVRNNYSLHSELSGVFDFIPSGFDQSQRFLLDLYDGSGSLDEHGILFQRCIEDPECLSRYDEALATVGPVMAEFDAQAEIDAIAAAIEPWVQADPRRAESLQEVLEAQGQTRSFWIDLVDSLQ